MTVKIIDFKTNSPFYEMERDGIKPFTIRQVDKTDKRFRILSQWNKDRRWLIRETNPDTGESFMRWLKCVSYLAYHDFSEPPDPAINYMRIDYDWKIIRLGGLVSEEELETLREEEKTIAKSYMAAVKAGHTKEDCNNCGDGELNCPGCPWDFNGP